MNKEKLNQLINEGRLAAKPEKVQAFQSVLATIQSEENRGNSVDVTNVIKKEYNKFIEAAQAFKNAKRVKSEREMLTCADYLKAYLPVELPEDQYPEKIDEAIKETNSESMRDMGKVMGLLKKIYGVSLDMGIASKLVKEKLS